MNSNADKYQLAAGLKAVELIVDQMDKGYANRIYDTGDLMRDVDFQVDGNIIKVGNSLEYSVPVHVGTRLGLIGRPYITDALTSASGKSELEKVGIKSLSQGF